MAFRNSSHGGDFDGATENTTGRTVFAMFHDRSDAERAIEALFNAGFTERDVGVAMRDRTEEKELMESAIAQARKSLSEGGIPIGSALACNGELLAVGHNKRVQESDPVTHAEIDCLRRAGYDQQRRRTGECGDSRHEREPPGRRCPQ